MIITTEKNPSVLVVKEARALAESWKAAYESRKKRSLRKWLDMIFEPIYVVGSTADKLYHPEADHPFYFHPSMSWIRVLRLERGEHDPMSDAMKLSQGMSVLDATMGLASDSIVASFVTGPNGKVTGLEKNLFVANIVAKGLRHWEEELPSFNQAMRRILIKNEDSLEYLKRQPDESHDVVYFDPMFQKRKESVHIEPLRFFAFYDFIKETHVKEAIRTARERVVMKTPYPSQYLEQLGFTFPRRRSKTSVCYAVIEKDGS